MDDALDAVEVVQALEDLVGDEAEHDFWERAEPADEVGEGAEVHVLENDRDELILDKGTIALDDVLMVGADEGLEFQVHLLRELLVVDIFDGLIARSKYF